jgi:hypothetical protein
MCIDLFGFAAQYLRFEPLVPPITSFESRVYSVPMTDGESLLSKAVDSDILIHLSLTAVGEIAT